MAKAEIHLVHKDGEDEFDEIKIDGKGDDILLLLSEAIVTISAQTKFTIERICNDIQELSDELINFKE